MSKLTEFRTRCVGCYDPLSDMWFMVVLMSKDPPLNTQQFRYGAGLFEYWKQGHNGRLLYKLVSILDET